VELKNRVEQIDATIRELRQNAGDGPKTRQLLDSLFRSVHTFKAAASAQGLDDLSRTAHEFENVLHSLRTGILTLDDEVLRALDNAAVAMREDGSQAASVNCLRELNHQTPESHELPTVFANLRDEERHRAAAALREGSNLYVMEAVFKFSDFDERFRQLKQRLEEVAELISTSATTADDKIIFQVVYASRSEKIRVHAILEQAVRAGNSVATKLAKNVHFVLTGQEFLLERRWADVLADALVHLVRNAVGHGIESTGIITLDAATQDEQTRITVTDDGRGIAPENIPLVFQPGFSTATEITELSGRGVGLDAVKVSIEKLGGSVCVTSQRGKGSSFEITMPDPIKKPGAPHDA
jgi:two-component system chemotaxis sensor kinase CheA